MKKLLLALALSLVASSAWAQNVQCPNRPIGDDTNACANTRFVQDAIGAAVPTLNQNQIFVGNASNQAVSVAMGGDCGIVAAGTITCSRTNGTLFGAFATGTDAANLTGTVSVNRFNGGSGASSSTYLRGDGTWVNPTTGLPTLSGINTWTGQNLFQNGRPWADVRAWGAVCNSSTDDTTAIQNAINHMQTNFGGGIVYFPPMNGRCCVASGLTITTSSIWLLSNGRQTAISSCNNDVTVLTINANYARVTGLNIIGRGGLTTDTFTITNPTVLISGGVGNIIENSQITGGYNAIKITGGGDWIIQDVFASQAYGDAVVKVQNSAGWFRRAKIDQEWPYSTPSGGTATYIARANTTVYAAGAIVSLSGYYLQATVGGTSGGSAPTLLVYGNDITDGTVTWRLVGATTYAGLNVDTGAHQIFIEQGDFNGSFTYGVHFTDSAAGADPSLVMISQTAFGMIINHNIFAQVGYGLYVNQVTFGSCAVLNCAGIRVDTNWAGPLHVSQSTFWNLAQGVSVASGGQSTITNNSFFNMTGYGFRFVSVNRNIFSNNVCSTNSNFGGAAAGCAESVGTSDYYIISNNICNGATVCITDGASGANKSVANNL